MNVLRKKVAFSTSELLDNYVSQLDQDFNAIDKYLAKISFQYIANLNINNGYDINKKDGENQVNNPLLEKFSEEIPYLNQLDMFFVYYNYDVQLIVSSNINGDIRSDSLKVELKQVIENANILENNKWNLVNNDGIYKLIKIIMIKPGFYLGVLSNIDTLFNPLKNLTINENYGFILCSKDSSILSSTFQSNLMLNLSNKSNLNSNEEFFTVTNLQTKEDYLAVKKDINILSLELYAISREKSLLADHRAVNLLLCIILVLVLLFFACYVFLYRDILLKPMYRISKSMRKVSRGDLGVKLKEDSSEEFNFIFRTFNNMVYELNYLKIDYYEEELKLQEAELKYLQSQIKPHFFLNSLNIIYNLATLKDYQTIKKMALYLGNYMHFTINNDSKMVILAEELNHISNYLKIQGLRLPNKLSFEIITKDNYGSVMIPPLTVQTFVENSVIHGMKRKTDSFIIKIIAEKRPGNILEIEVIDNGDGFSKEKLREFQQRKFGKSRGHIGIWNVYQRLYLNFKDEADLKFFNAEGGGAVVKIAIPIYEMEVTSDVQSTGS